MHQTQKWQNSGSILRIARMLHFLQRFTSKQMENLFLLWQGGCLGKQPFMKSHHLFEKACTQLYEK